MGIDISERAGGFKVYHTDESADRGFEIRCFGEFEVFYKGEVLHFPRKKAKEALAFLVDREGQKVTNQVICDVLWAESASDRARQRNYFHHVYGCLRRVLADVGYEDILLHEYDSYAICMEKVSCDYYTARDGGQLPKKPDGYMTQYAWAGGVAPFYRKEKA